MKKFILFLIISASLYQGAFAEFTALIEQGNIRVTTGTVGDPWYLYNNTIIGQAIIAETTGEGPFYIHFNSMNSGYTYLDDIDPLAVYGMPPGMSLDGASGQIDISSVPTTAGIYYFSIIDNNGFGTRIFQFTILEQPIEEQVATAQGTVDGFGSGAISSMLAASSGPVGTIIYVLIGILIFLIIAGFLAYLIYKLGKSNK